MDITSKILIISILSFILGLSLSTLIGITIEFIKHMNARRKINFVSAYIYHLKEEINQTVMFQKTNADLLATDGIFNKLETLRKYKKKLKKYKKILKS